MSGWTTKKLGEIGTIVRGKGIRRSETISKGMPCIRYGEIYTSYDILLDEPHSFVTKEIFDACPHIKHGDVVFTLTGENKEEIAKTLAYLGDEEIAAGGDLAIWKGHGFNAKFLAYVMNSPQLLKAKALASNGDIIVHASLKKMAEIPIPIPPLAEQKRIVAKIDAAFEKIDRLKANAEKNLANAKELFQSALDEAMRPKRGWGEKRLGEIGSCKNGLNFKRAAEGEKIDIVGVSDFKKGLVVDDATELERLTLQELPEQEWYLHPNDIVFVRSNGSKALVGRAVIIKSKRPLTFSGFCIRYRIEDKRIDPDYLARIVSVESFRKAMLSGRNATTINNVTQPILLSQVISIPSLGEQKQIIKHLDFLSEKIKMLEQNYARQIADCAEMRQAILREAFEGRL